MYLERFNQEGGFEGIYCISFVAAGSWIDDDADFGSVLLIHYVVQDDEYPLQYTPETNDLKFVAGLFTAEGNDDDGDYEVIDRFTDGDWTIELFSTEGGVATVSITFGEISDEVDVDCVGSTAGRNACRSIGQQLYTLFTEASNNGKPCTGKSTRCVAGDGTIPPSNPPDDNSEAIDDDDYTELGGTCNCEC